MSYSKLVEYAANEFKMSEKQLQECFDLKGIKELHYFGSLDLRGLKVKTSVKCVSTDVKVLQSNLKNRLATKWLAEFESYWW